MLIKALRCRRLQNNKLLANHSPSQSLGVIRCEVSPWVEQGCSSICGLCLRTEFRFQYSFQTLSALSAKTFLLQKHEPNEIINIDGIAGADCCVYIRKCAYLLLCIEAKAQRCDPCGQAFSHTSSNAIITFQRDNSRNKRFLQVCTSCMSPETMNCCPWIRLEGGTCQVNKDRLIHQQTLTGKNR